MRLYHTVGRRAARARQIQRVCRLRCSHDAPISTMTCSSWMSMHPTQSVRSNAQATKHPGGTVPGHYPCQVKPNSTTVHSAEKSHRLYESSAAVVHQRRTPGRVRCVGSRKSYANTCSGLCIISRVMDKPVYKRVLSPDSGLCSRCVVPFSHDHPSPSALIVKWLSRNFLHG